MLMIVFSCLPNYKYCFCLLWFISYHHGKTRGSFTQQGSISKSFYRSKGFLPSPGVIRHQWPALLFDPNPYTHCSSRRISVAFFDTQLTTLTLPQVFLCPLGQSPLEISPYILNYSIVYFSGYSFLSQLISCFITVTSLYSVIMDLLF